MYLTLNFADVRWVTPVVPTCCKDLFLLFFLLLLLEDQLLMLKELVRFHLFSQTNVYDRHSEIEDAALNHSTYKVQ